MGFIFAASAVLRIGMLEYAEAEAIAPAAPTFDTPAREPAVSGPPTDFMAPLRDAMEDVESQRASLATREAAVADRERAVAAAQHLVEVRLTELEAAEQRLQDLITLSDGAAEADLARLTNVYETMGAEQVAPLFEQMDPSFAAGFMARMAAPAGAAVMAELSPEFAYAVSVVLATRNATAPVLGAEISDEDTEN
ncbi:MAG: hypothetical protein AAF376_10320 [Pseudomonadota bacterium]